MSSRAPTFLSHADADAGADARREAMLEAALDCIVTMDASGCVVDLNTAAERTFGYSRDEARGRRLGDLIVPPEHRARHDAGLRRHLEGGTAAMLGRRL
jgi:PAS domain S-box-containing protein